MGGWEIDPRERERHTHTQTDRQTDRQTDKQTERGGVGETEREREGWGTER